MHGRYRTTGHVAAGGSEAAAEDDGGGERRGTSGGGGGGEGICGDAIGGRAAAGTIFLEWPEKPAAAGLRGLPEHRSSTCMTKLI
eukprot:gene10558-biopygen1771